MKRDDVCPRWAHKAYAPTSPHRPQVSSAATVKDKSLTRRLHRRQAFIRIFKVFDKLYRFNRRVPWLSFGNLKPASFESFATIRNRKRWINIPERQIKSFGAGKFRFRLKSRLIAGKIKSRRWREKDAKDLGKTDSRIFCFFPFKPGWTVVTGVARLLKPDDSRKF